MEYIPPEYLYPPRPSAFTLAIPVPEGTLAPPVPTTPQTALKATEASDLSSPPPYRAPQQISLVPNPYPPKLQPRAARKLAG